MQRFEIEPRQGWQQLVEAKGLIWHTTESGAVYWDESGYYKFRLEAIKMIESITTELYNMFIAAGEFIVNDKDMLDVFGIPEFCHQAIRDAWAKEPPALNYGRFDLGWNGGLEEPKLFEFNCDTPTSMLEAGVIQWDWKEQVFPGLDQYTSLHEKLMGKWADIRPYLPGQRVWFAHTDDSAAEDTITATYMRDLAQQAGLETFGVVVDDIGVDADGIFVDGENQIMTAIYKLYPWEWLVSERYGPQLIKNLPAQLWIEPIWKMMWSNKAILEVLWRMYPNHKNLLKSSVKQEEFGSTFVAKPFLAREGANVELVNCGQTIAKTEGLYQEGLMMYQDLYPLKDFGHGYPVLGAWTVDGEPAGMGIREDGLITGNTARFIPHVIEN
jgi:glutathionylspermidine synthase